MGTDGLSSLMHCSLNSSGTLISNKPSQSSLRPHLWFVGRLLWVSAQCQPWLGELVSIRDAKAYTNHSARTAQGSGSALKKVPVGSVRASSVVLPAESLTETVAVSWAGKLLKLKSGCSQYVLGRYLLPAALSNRWSRPGGTSGGHRGNWVSVALTFTGAFAVPYSL